MITDEQLSAFAKGDLDPEAAARVEAALKSQPDLLDRLAALSSATPKPREKPAPKPRRPLRAPNVGLALAKAGAGLSALAAAIAAFIRAVGRRLAPLAGPAPPFVRWMLLAGALAAGLVAGRLTTSADVVEIEAGALRPSSQLAHVLDMRRTRDPRNDRAPVRIAQSFRALDGLYCRTFADASRGVLSGLACRGADGWEVRALASGALGQGALAPGLGEAPVIRDIVDAVIVGVPLDDDQERAAIAQGWRD